MTLVVDGVTPGRVDHPRSPEELVAALTDAGTRKERVLALGAGTRAPHGPPPDGIPRAISTAALDDIVTWEPGDQTLRVQAGMRLADLDARLADERQVLPLHRARGTVGGLLATAADGVCDLGYGRARDRVLGCTVALADGRLARGRGHVVKNVAGYDLPRLLVGSFGTLGVLLEASFKLEPRPPEQGSARADFADVPSAFEAARTVLDSGIEPVFANVLADASRDHAHLVVGFDGSAARVQGGLDALAPLLAPHAPDTLIVHDPGADADLRARLDDPATMTAAESPRCPEPVVLRCAVPPTRLPGLARGLVQSARNGVGAIRLDGRPGLGLMFVSIDAPGDDARLALAEAALVAARALGHATVLAAPASMRRTMDCWGPAPPDFALMRRVKSALDPDGVLLAGRYVGGL
jgi:glycolate oxidase FAD binding subunit